MRLPIAGLLAASVALAGCAELGIGPKKSSASSSAKMSDQTMTVSSKIPSTEGTVKFSVAENDNTAVDLAVKHLPQPQKLTPPAHVYVVWTKAGNGAKPQNIGALTVDPELTGTLETITPLHKFELQVTAEANGQVQEPSGEPLLTASFSR